MAHTVTFSVPGRSLGREDIEFVVVRDGVRFGTLLVSKGRLNGGQATTCIAGGCAGIASTR